jgi:hypothetical protein
MRCYLYCSFSLPIFYIILSLPNYLQAALLPIPFVVEQVSKSAGRGNYQLSHSVEFRLGDEVVLRMRENWFLGANSILQAEVRSSTGELRGLIYAQFQDRHSVLSNLNSQSFKGQSIHGTRVRNPHALWMTRSGSQLILEFKSLGLLQGYQPEVRQSNQFRDFAYPLSPYTSLKRQGKSILIALGEAADRSEHFVGVDQDQFVVARVEASLPRPHQIIASEILEHAGGFKYPAIREITWPQWPGARGVPQAIVRTQEVKEVGRQVTPPNPPAWSQRNFDGSTLSREEVLLLEAYFF